MSATPVPPPAIAEAVTMTAGPLSGYLVTEGNLAALAELLGGELAPYSTETIKFRAGDGYLTEVEAGDVVVRLAEGGWAAIYRTELGNLWHAAAPAAEVPQ